MKNKNFFFGFLVILVLFIVVFILNSSQKQQSLDDEISYAFDKSKFCPEYGDCKDQGLESRQCIEVSSCTASCSYGCVNTKWLEGKTDCEAIWPNFKCECINNVCQRN